MGIWEVGDDTIDILDAKTIITCAVVGVISLIEIAPIKVNPWSAIANWIGHAFNKEIMDEVSSLKSSVNMLKADFGEQSAKAARVRILRFGEEIYRDVRHTKEHFDQILVDISEYDKYCAEHPDFVNNMTVITTQKIKETYKKCMDEKSFL